MSNAAAKASFLLGTLLAAASAFAAPEVGVSGHCDAFADAVQADRDARQVLLDGGDRAQIKVVKALNKILAVLAKPATAASYAGEMGAVAKAVGILGKKGITDGSVLSPTDPCRTLYLADLQTARGDLAALVPTLTGKAAKAAAKRLARADATLSRAAASTTPTAQLSLYAKAAKLLSPTPGVPPPEGVPSPSGIAIDSTGRFLYVAEYGDLEYGGTFAGDVRQMRIAADGSLADLSPARVTAGSQPIAVVTHPSAAFAYVANGADGTVSQFAIGADGTLAPLSPATVALAGTLPRSMAVDPDGKFVFVLGATVAGSPLTALAIGADGKLTEKGTDYAGTSPGGVAAAPSTSARPYVFTTAAGGSGLPELRGFSVAADGTVTYASVVQSSQGLYFGGVLVDPSRTLVYATRNPDDGTGTYRVYLYSILADGRLEPVAGDAPTGANAGDMAMDPSRTHLYAADSSMAGGVWQYAVGVDGSLTALAPALVAAPRPGALAMHPNGTRLYALHAFPEDTSSPIVTTLAIAADGTLGPP